MRLPSTPTLSRNALLRAIVAFGVSQPLVSKPASAASMYTIVPSGSIADKRARLVEATKKFEAEPENPYAFGEKAQLEYDIATLERNKAFTQKISKDVAAGTTVFPQSLTIGVPDMKEAITFWTRGVGCIVLSTMKNADGANVTRVGFGPESLKAEDGAKFALELVELQKGQTQRWSPETSVVQYIQLAIPVFRLSQVMQWGGEVQSSYGWTEATAPGGLPLRVAIDESRRDPFQFVALRVTDVKASKAHYESLGMRVVTESEGRRKVKLFDPESSWGSFEDKAAIEPDRYLGACVFAALSHQHSCTIPSLH